MKQELAQYPTLDPQTLLPLVELVFEVQRVPERWLGWGGWAAQPSKPGGKEGKPWEAGPPVLGAALGMHLASCWQQALCHQPRAGAGRGITVSGRGRCPWSAGHLDSGST